MEHPTDQNTGITDDERTEFWASWARLAIAWGLIFVGALIMLTGHWSQPVHILVTSVVVGSAACVAKLAWTAVRRLIEEWHDRRE